MHLQTQSTNQNKYNFATLREAITQDKRDGTRVHHNLPETSYLPLSVTSQMFQSSLHFIEWSEDKVGTKNRSPSLKVIEWADHECKRVIPDGKAAEVQRREKCLAAANKEQEETKMNPLFHVRDALSTHYHVTALFMIWKEKKTEGIKRHKAAIEPSA